MKIFINYRRDDSACHAGRIYDRLRQHFGDEHVFMDMHRIAPGDDFVKVIKHNIENCSALIVLIGRGWLNARDRNGTRRLEQRNDFVRAEIAAALKRKVCVVPVLIDGASPPKADALPAALAPLARHTALEVSDVRFHSDMDRLIQSLVKALHLRSMGVFNQAPGSIESSESNR